LAVVQLNAFLTLGGREELKRASLQPLVPNAESIPIPEQDLEPVAIAIQEQEQVTGRGVLVKDLLRSTHQAIETVIHLRGGRAQEDPHVGKGRHDFGAFQGRSAPTARMTSTRTT
jgi:hypothetical protein